MRRLNVEKLEGETVESLWDIKKIAIGLIILAFLISLGVLMLFPNSNSQDESKDRKALGISSEDNTHPGVPTLPTKEDIENILRDAQDTLSKITSENLTSSQAAIQKLITDLEVLQGEKNVKDVICDLVCKDR